MKSNLTFIETPNPGKKTKVWDVNSVHDGSYLGRVGFLPQWRKYVFSPTSGALFDWSCLTEITGFLTTHKDDRQ